MLKIQPFFVVLATLAGLAVPSAHAGAPYPGEAAVVIHYCGKPNAEGHTANPSTGTMRRDLYYGDTILHFEPIEDGWAFTSAWQGSLPISRRAIEERMPCFHEAMLQVAASPVKQVDPTIAMQSIQPAVANSNGLGVPFFWLIFALAIVLIVVVTLPAARKNQARKLLRPEEREFRKPAEFLRPFRIKSRDPNRLDT